jgi:predicted sugar kinase
VCGCCVDFPEEVVVVVVVVVVTQNDVEETEEEIVLMSGFERAIIHCLARTCISK